MTAGLLPIEAAYHPGLRLRFALDGEKPFRAVFLAALGVAGYVVLVDQYFRASLTPAYLHYWTTGTLGDRLVANLIGAMRDEIVFRGLVMTSIILTLTRLAGLRRTAPLVLAAIFAAQALNVAGDLTAQPLYAALRYLVPGIVWGCLYIRHGWTAAAGAHMLCHVFLDPVQGVFL